MSIMLHLTEYWTAPNRQIFSGAVTEVPASSRRRVLHPRENAAGGHDPRPGGDRAWRSRDQRGGMTDARRQCVHDMPIARIAATLNSPSHEIAATF